MGRQEHKINLSLAVRVPMVPNFIRSIRNDESVDICELTDSQLKAIGALWTQALLASAAFRRSKRPRK